MDKGEPSQKSWRESLIGFSVFFALVLGLSIIFYTLISKGYAQVVISSEGAQLTDFVYYLENVKEFWFGSKPQLYRPETTQVILARLLGDDFPPAMLLHIIPPALVIWLPLALAGLKSAAWAHALWLGFSYALVGQALLNLYRFVNPRVKIAGYVLIAVFLCSFFSFVTLANIVLGQTSIFMGAVLMLLLHRLQNAHPSQPATDAQLILYGILLGIKPQFFLFGIIILLLFSRRNEVIWAIALTAIICIFLTPRLGWLWPVEYLQIISKHSTATLPEFFSATIILDIMTNFRGAFYKYIGSDSATTISTVVFIGSNLGVALMGLRYTLQVPKEKSSASMTHARFLWSLVMLESYLLFSPHLYAYEDFLTITLIAMVFLVNPAQFKRPFWTLVLFVLFFVNLQSRIFTVRYLQLLFWLLKLSFGICVGISLWPKRVNETNPLNGISRTFSRSIH